MARFTVRVELHDAEASDYGALHKHMAAEGFTRTIGGGDGTEYHLPEAEYAFDGFLTRGAVLNKADNAAGKTKRTRGIVVTESAGRTWRGLAKV